MSMDDFKPYALMGAVAAGLLAATFLKKKKEVSERKTITTRVNTDWMKSTKALLPTANDSVLLVNGLHSTEKYHVDHLDDYIDGLPTYDSPLMSREWPLNRNFTSRDETMVETQFVFPLDNREATLTREFVHSGPRAQVYFKPEQVKAVIVTCGGLCPGLNTVIREITMALCGTYDCKSVFGAMGGYTGLVNGDLKELTPESVFMIHQEGGTILGSSRGGFKLGKIIKTLIKNEITHLYIIGGDGTHRGALKIANECRRLKLHICVAAIPKTIDNDIAFIDQSFGFDSSVSEAILPINCAAIEAQGAPNGIGLIKLMGRNSGFIAMHATCAARQVDACLIPEMNFKINELCLYIEERLASQGHCIIVVAEGAGQDLMESTGEKDPSGNAVFSDIGLFLKQRINKYFEAKKVPINLKYIDPTYMIRSIPANAADSFMCSRLAFAAVHGCMAGFTNFSTGQIDNHYVLLPIAAIASAPTVKVNVRGREYARMCMNTLQPTFGGQIVQARDL